MALKTEIKQHEIDFIKPFVNLSSETSDFYVFHTNDKTFDASKLTSFFECAKNIIFAEQPERVIYIVESYKDDDAFKITEECDFIPGTGIPEPVVIAPVDDNAGTQTEQLETAPAVSAPIVGGTI